MSPPPGLTWEDDLDAPSYEGTASYTLLVEDGSGDYVTTGMVAAFADDGTIRGYQEPSEIPFGPYAGEYAFLITVYGDGGDSVDDWEYSSNGFSSTTITTDSSISWSANANYGSVTDPIIFE